ncbi:MAG: hypothetical protein H7338_21665 [Candidatus Sericytochromatia bacterium]|nr:hypothetical protein [Candidatus Sericytochromatia bacterium]
MGDVSLKPVETAVATAIGAGGAIAGAAAAAVVAAKQPTGGPAAPNAAAPAGDTVKAAKTGVAAAVASLDAPISEHGQVLQAAVKQLTSIRERQTGAVAKVADAAAAAPGPFKGIRLAIAAHAHRVHAQAIQVSGAAAERIAAIAVALPGEPIKTPQPIIDAAKRIATVAEGVTAHLADHIDSTIERVSTKANGAAEHIDQAVKQAADTLRNGGAKPQEIHQKLYEGLKEALDNLKPHPIHIEFKKAIERLKDLHDLPIGDFPKPDPNKIWA